MFITEVWYLKEDLARRNKSIHEAIVEDVLESFKEYEKLNGTVTEYKLNIQVFEKQNMFHVKVTMIK